MQQSVVDLHEAEPGNKDVLVAIVNYATPHLVLDCLASLAAELGQSPRFRVVVADNASPDDSVARLEGAIRANGWSDWVTILPLPRNGGFAYGNNAAIQHGVAAGGSPDFVWLLNSDTVVRPGALAKLLAFLERRPRAGIVGSRLEDPDGTAQLSAFRFHSVLSEFESSMRLGLLSRLLDRWRVAPPIAEVEKQFDWVSGASMLIRAETLRDTGPMDEAYFLYYEETDFCLRARQAGWECWYEPASRVVHLVGTSTGVTDRKSRSRRRAGYWFHSRQRYFIKHHGLATSVAADLAVVVGTAFWLLRARAQRKPSEYPERFLSDLIRSSAIVTRLFQPVRT